MKEKQITDLIERMRKLGHIYSYQGVKKLILEYEKLNKPSHYQGRFGMESIDALRNFMTPEQLKGFYLGNALKYQLRFQKKNGLEDLKKARKNLDWLIEEMENEN